MNKFLLLLVALSIAWIIIVFNTAGLTGLITAQPSGSRAYTDEAAGDAIQEPTIILFSGHSFDDTEDLRQYTELMAEYNALHEGYLATQAMVDGCYAELGFMSLEYDMEFGGRPRTQTSDDALSAVNQKLEECQALSGMLAYERRALEYTNQSISNRVKSLE
jgi:hypothetical protein